MSLRRQIGSLRKLVRNPIHRRRLWAGWRFDRRTDGLFRLGDLAFEVPRELTDLPFRGQFFENSYEYDERVVVERFVAEADCVLELGGCLGVVAAVANRQLAQPERHLVMEANPDAAAVLARNRDRNGLAFAILEGVLSPQPTQTFFVSTKLTSGSQIVGNGQPITVRGYSWESVVSQLGSTPSCLIADIEGGERDVLDYLATKNFAGLTTLILEFHPGILGHAETDRLRGLLAQSGFTQTTVQDQSEVFTRPATATRDIP